MTTLPDKKAFSLDFSNRVIEHLGVKLYQNKPTNVIAEFLSNCWDADARSVNIDIRAGGGTGPEIVITDDGKGMGRNELTDEFLIIGRNRRVSALERSTGNRPLMGRKGIGKLAGFGIARVLDVITIPNPLRRAGYGPEQRRACWLRFHLDAIVAISTSTTPAGYKPEVIADDCGVDELSAIATKNGVVAHLEVFLKQISQGGGGTVIHLKETTLRKSINPDQLLASLGSRFTVALLRPDFVVKVNDKLITPSMAFPAFQDFSVGTFESPIVSDIIIDGVSRSVRHWARFVNLADADWPIESAGVGIYAHGKIAQDRPFFFGVLGKEILSRYLYAVVEADWLDEMDEDVVSTDRRSLNWDLQATSDLHKWGHAQVSGWLEGFRKWKQDKPRDEVKKKIRERTKKSLTGTEEDALADLLVDVLIGFGNNEQAKDEAITRFSDAWIHEPTRQLTKKLWIEVFSATPNSPAFVTLLDKLKDSLIPEALGLAVTMAQRVAAITTMRAMIEQDKSETDLQRLIEFFPWLLGPQWEKLTANQTIRTLVESKLPSANPVSEADAKLKPDFVFLADPGLEQEVVVFELKGPECEKTLQPVELQQLINYLNIIEGAYTNVAVTGYIVAHQTGGARNHDNRVKELKWSDVLLHARKLHVSYLGALLKASEPDASDARLQQIATFGGGETIQLINRLAKIADFPEIVASSLLAPKNISPTS